MLHLAKAIVKPHVDKAPNVSEAPEAIRTKAPKGRMETTSAGPAGGKDKNASAVSAVQGHVMC